jgi:glycosyltransferase involved in cell wall biosynthesis
VPTAERDATIGLSILQPLFRNVRAVMYNSPEERAMIQAVSGNTNVPGVVVGIGSDVPSNPQAARFRQKYKVRGPFAVYVGRIDQNKGCKELFEFFQGYLKDPSGKLSLMLIGHSLLPIPEHPRIRHLGFLDDTDKFDAMAAADLLIMPSYYESLSMVALEAWALGRPVLVNGKCDVLKGQCIRSNAGLYYENYGEFIATLEAIEQNRWLAGTLGRNGRQFFREQYDWPVIERKYLEMFERLRKETPAPAVDPLPGWFERRRQDLPAAEEVLAKLPTGPAGRRT